ncbi:DUF5518 domain-containing protein [Haloarcula sp. JP-L23]|uniref:DUF5518 domain-containing protein n=1 Tax=Haloarcula sp. JP-L23 TaxID=2716717 RepID=UPI00140F0810|nr:DUF5518 domain-containing protein [Haloarcula sp. JP-L23]
MTRIGSLHPELSVTWTYAIPGGLATIPFTVASYWSSGEAMAFSSVFVAAVATGYLAKRHGLESTPVGVRTGLVGALPVALLLADILGAATALGGPLPFVAAASVLTAGFLVTILGLVVGLSVLLGWAGGRLGGWLAERNSHGRPPAVGN